MAILTRDEDTICAVATPPGKGGISVIRVSGTKAYSACRQLCHFLPTLPESHKVFYGVAKDSDGPVDEVLVTYFQKGKSFTGEDTVEISCHGSPTITQLLLSALNSHDVRLAEPGEFTYRAFISGRIDLVQAEGVLEVIESQSQRASRMALKQLQGHHSTELSKIEDQVTWVLAHCEANIDFAAEDIETASQVELTQMLLTTQESIQKLLSSYQLGKGLRDGVFTLLIGEPNVGKSSLLNSMVGFDKAIVTDIPGTTRDVVEGELWHKGFRIQLSDTAGVRASNDQIENLGIQKSLDLIGHSDKIAMVIDLSRPLKRLSELVKPADLPKANVVILMNKCDQAIHSNEHVDDYIYSIKNELEIRPGDELTHFKVSAKTGEGLDEFLDYLVKDFLDASLSDQSAVFSNSRHRELLNLASQSLSQSILLMQERQSPEFVAFELQSGLIHIQEILGKKFDDQVMDRVFNEFCLGK